MTGAGCGSAKISTVNVLLPREWDTDSMACHLVSRVKVEELQFILQFSKRWHSWEGEAACTKSKAHAESQRLISSFTRNTL